MRFSGELYTLERGIGFNDKAYKVHPIPGNMKSFRFISLLKKTIEKETGHVGMSLNSIVTGIAGAIGFHHKKDYDYYMKKVKNLWKENEMKSEMTKILKNANKIAKKIVNGESGLANCIIIKSTNPHYDEIKEILEKN